ncbi:inositol 2-dehydrogenase [Alphaproteobacteria bacterium KMM 3653]|uniref:Inositol 2-dehydrogenase n=1 Tax=Harenicola maris TaxID=2841044 RepID=A0AAP2CM45_9RHOB|nr:inositol 2-dehydrogenase [Harenicola maris]
MKIGILGCGRIGIVHARSLMSMPGVALVAVSDFHAPAAQALAQKTGAQVRSTEEILGASDIDAVVIGTPTDTHFEIIHAAAGAGKAIFCEKPIDMSADRTRACVAAVEAAGVPFLTGFNRRFDANFASIQRQIADGAIGDVELLTILSRDPSPPPISYIETSGGLFQDMMIHDFDMARFLLGEEPVTAYAVGAALVDPAIGAAGDVDTAAVTLTTASGRICQISNSRRASYGYDQRVEVHGSKGMLRAENVLENQVELATSSGFARAPAQNFFLERYEGAYLAEMTHFVEAVQSGAPCTPTALDGLRAQLIAVAAKASLASGQPVEIAAK